MKNLDESFSLAKEMVKIADSVGRKAVAIITDMDIPLGKAIGNSLEVIESIETLKGKGPRDLEEVSFELAARMVQLGLEKDYEESLVLVKEAVDSGKALEKLKELIKNQGGNSSVVDDYSLFGEAKICEEFKASNDGYISHIETDELGKASVVLGAGRETKESDIDYTAGIIMEKKTGDKVSKGDIIARVFTNQHGKVQEALKLISDSVKISNETINKKPLILGFVDMENMLKY
jgi:pyrimidine-nucleoside phosphorylase